MRVEVDVVGRFTRMWKTGVVVAALVVTAVACGNSEDSRERNAALVAGTACTKSGQAAKISKVSVVCAQTSTGKIWYQTMKSQGRAVSCSKAGAVRKKKSVVWVCEAAKGKKVWRATSPLPPAVLQLTAVVEPGSSQPLPVLESTNVASPSQPVVADGNVLADPAIADEAPVTIPSTIPATTTPTAPVSYSVGDTGPGGGKVFYVATSVFTSTGSACGTECKYLEAAPTGWMTAATPVGQTNCTGRGTGSFDPKCEWSGNTSAAVGTTGTAIGAGYANTSAMIAQNNSTGKAATVARAFQGGGKTDWFLPSKDELNQMFVNKTAISGSFSSVYWSSSENAAGEAWLQYVDSGEQFGDGNKSNTYYVRPVRAFSLVTTPTAPATNVTVATVPVTNAPISYKVGDTGPGGGIIFYKDLARPVGSQYFEAACAGWSDGICGGDDIADPRPAWGCGGVSLSGADGSAIGDGKQNTADIVKECKEARIAASLADDLVLGSQSDWFLASKDELNQMYLQKSAVGGLASLGYWTSTEFGLANRLSAVYQVFSNGTQTALLKSTVSRVRPVRSF
jgi:hypothetical protein